jgi:hypothetical protein
MSKFSVVQAHTKIPGRKPFLFLIFLAQGFRMGTEFTVRPCRSVPQEHHHRTQSLRKHRLRLLSTPCLYITWNSADRERIVTSCQLPSLPWPIIIDDVWQAAGFSVMYPLTPQTWGLGDALAGHSGLDSKLPACQIRARTRALIMMDESSRAESGLRAFPLASVRALRDSRFAPI